MPTSVAFCLDLVQGVIISHPHIVRRLGVEIPYSRVLTHFSCVVNALVDAFFFCMQQAATPDSVYSRLVPRGVVLGGALDAVLG